MKKKIAVCGNGWSNEYLKIIMSGIRKCAAENNVDIFLLLNYSVEEVEAYKNVGEANIFRLLDYAKFDGAIILGNALHLEEEYSYLADKVKELNEQLRSVYGDIMSAPAMVEYNTAKAALDSLVNEINTVISKTLDGEDPETCDTTACTGSCATCGGCH